MKGPDLEGQPVNLEILKGWIPWELGKLGCRLDNFEIPLLLRRRRIHGRHTAGARDAFLDIDKVPTLRESHEAEGSLTLSGRSFACLLL